MGICPRCGSWVDDGDVCRSCGGVRKTNDDYKQTPVNNGNQYNDGYNPPIHSYPYWDYDVKESKYYNKIKKCLSKKVIEELTKEGYSLEAQIYCLIETIEDLENDFNCDFEKIYYKKKPFDYIAIECINKTGKLLDARLTCEFIRDQYYLDDLNDIKLSFDEEYITKSDVFKKLKRNMEAEGYKYVRMDYYPRDFHNEYVTIWFTKSTSVIDLAKSFSFSLKNNDIHDSWESIYFDDGFYYSDDENINSRETRRLKKKIKEIEKEYKCKYEDAYGLELSFGWKTYYYDLETKDLKKESNLLKLKQYPKEQLFTISGNSINRFKKGTKIKLVKESDNKIDYNHLAVYLDDNKIGYVSRGGYGVSGASELNISDYAYGEYLTLAVNENSLYPVFRLIKTQPKKTPYQIKRLKEETNPILKKCNEYKKAKQYMEVDKCYDELIKLNPTVKNWEDKAANLINMEKYEEAQESLNKAKSLSKFPNSTSIQAIQKTINNKRLE